MARRAMKGFEYSFPPSAIAQAPASPRDAAKLLVYDRKSKKASWATFRDLPKYLPARSVLVMNETKVVPARLTVSKPTGGRVRVLYVGHGAKEIKVLADRELKPGMELAFRGGSFEVLRREGKFYFLKPSFPVSRIHAVLERYGTAPIPPYIKGTPLSPARLRAEYQTVFAKRKGSVAAPTASLHFTKRLLAELKKAGHEMVFVTLHVNLGTFAPLTEEQMRTGRLHEEEFEISLAAARKLMAAKAAGRPVVAVGTTVVRTLESAADGRGNLVRLKGSTDIFIRPPYRPKFVDHLITNFHVPGSSLLMLVASFVPRAALLALYRAALRKNFRLFSFGDGMLVV
jgi:S-adenosylmethionine:tRNA ribosyltransferase-isomerase